MEEPAKQPWVSGFTRASLRETEARHRAWLGGAPGPASLSRGGAEKDGGSKKAGPGARPGDVSYLYARHGSWESFHKDEAAQGALFRDVTAMREEGKSERPVILDWSAAFAEVSAKTGGFDDGREYSGVINLDKKGVPCVTKMLPADGRESEELHELTNPADLVRVIDEKPGLFRFHVRPREDDEYHFDEFMPSLPDMLKCFGLLEVPGRYAADLLFCRFGVVMYYPTQDAINRVHDEEIGAIYEHNGANDPTYRTLVNARMFEMQCALVGVFNVPWRCHVRSVSDFDSLARRYGVEIRRFSLNTDTRISQWHLTWLSPVKKPRTIGNYEWLEELADKWWERFHKVEEEVEEEEKKKEKKEK